MSRSVSTGVMLFVPASDASKVSKIPTLDADSIILDLEDSVAHDSKEKARAQARDAIRRWGHERQLWVRVNPGPELLRSDLESVTRPGLAGVLLPKADSSARVEDLAARLTALERDRGIEHPLAVSPTIESVSGLRAVDEIAACERVSFLTLGMGDLSLDYGIDWPIDEIDHPLLVDARVRLAQASRVAGLVGPHDGAYPRYADSEGLRRHAEFARKFGFSSKHAIHPGHPTVIRGAFAFSEDEVKRARQIVESFDAAVRDGVASISVGGSLVDYPVWQRAKAVLASVSE